MLRGKDHYTNQAEPCGVNPVPRASCNLQKKAQESVREPNFVNEAHNVSCTEKNKPCIFFCEGKSISRGGERGN